MEVIEKGPTFRITPSPNGTVQVEASLFKVGVKSEAVTAEISPNINTGASISKSHIGGSFLGFGGSIGSDTHIATPFGKFGLKF